MSVNKVILIGHVGKDPEVKYFDNGSAVTNFTLATTERGYTAANGTQIPDRTEWHNIVCWRALAKVAEQFVVKGSQLYVEGKIRTRNYDDTSGIKRYITEIYADSIDLLGRKKEEPSNTPVSPTNVGTAPSPKTSMSEKEADDLPF